MLHRVLILLSIVAAVAAAAAPASAKTTIDVQVGWGDKFRPGRWTPLYVTVSDTVQRQAVIEIYAPTDRRYAMRIRQGLAIGPVPVTVPIYLPLSYQLNETSVAIYNAEPYRRLESTILSDFPAYQGQRSGPESVGANQWLIGISGKAGTERLVQSQFQQQNIISSYLAQQRLPASGVGYDMLDLLILNQPDLVRISLEQQQAIVDWVRSGGVLVVWPGPEPIPPVSPFTGMLPATIGATRTYEIDQGAIAKAGLPSRFGKLTGRGLSNPAPDATPVPLFGDADATAYRRWVGFGQVVLVPVDLSTLVFDTDQHAVDFWRQTLKGVVTLPQRDDTTNQHPYGMADPNRAVALRQAMDWISDIPGAGRFGFSYLAGVLLAMMLVVGPVDWFVLKRLGRQPWTWVTITGWIALVTLGAIYIGHIFKSGDVFFRTASVIDETEGSRVAAVDIMGIYSPQTTAYDLALEPESWWRPASEVNPYGSSGLQLELGFHQDYRGNRPTPMVINVWNMRFLEGLDATPAPPMIEATLSRAGSNRVSGKHRNGVTRTNPRTRARITGEIVNRSDVTLTDLRIRTQQGLATVSELSIPPGGRHAIDVHLLDDPSLAASRPTDQEQWMYRYQSTGPTSRPSALTMNGVAERRSQRIDQMLADRADLACVYADFESTAPPPRVRLNVGETNASHRGVVRALVPLGSEGPAR